MDCISLDQKTIDAIAIKAAKAVVREMKREQELQERGFVPISEAANILGVSVSHLRAKKDKFPHVKYGEGKYGRLFFKKDTLVSVMESLTSDPNVINNK
jgi:hypothetical protein